MSIVQVKEGSVLACRVAVAAVSREAAYTAEMTSQLVYGETCVVTGPLQRKWYPVTCSYDGYTGFVLKSQFDALEQPAPGRVHTLSADGWLNTGQGKTLLPIGALLGDEDMDHYSGRTIHPGNLAATAENIQMISELFLNTPYLWGGKSSFGIDCSGFTQTVYRLLNIALPRDAWQQAEKGTAVGFLQEAQTGDLAFFDDEEGKIIHTGILLNDHTIIHAAGNVHTDPIDHAGISDARNGERTHKLRIIKRIV